MNQLEEMEKDKSDLLSQTPAVDQKEEQPKSTNKRVGGISMLPGMPMPGLVGLKPLRSSVPVGEEKEEKKEENQDFRSVLRKTGINLRQ